MSLQISIEGLPVLSGEVLSPASAAFESLKEPEDFVRFACRLRGQFCIVIDQGPRIVAITDFGCSRPVFYTRGGGWKVTTRLVDLVPSSGGHVAKDALFFYVSRGGVGIVPFHAGIQEVFPATVAFFEGERLESIPYIDWSTFLETRPIAPAEAERRFVEVASSYLLPIARSRGPIASLLSSGTDSALIAWLLRQCGLDAPSLTADYRWKRYSEFDGAAESARALGVSHQRVHMTASSRREAFSEVNSSRQQAPCCHSQVPVMYALAQHAQRRGISTLVTGDHADALFLGFDRFFQGLPADPAAYSQAVAALDTRATLGRLYQPPQRTTAWTELLSAFGCTEDERLASEERMYSANCREMSAWIGRAPLHTLQQLIGQTWAGISWQNTFLPVSRAFDDRVEFVSPFYDIDMIRFAMSLPIEYKFRDGRTKVLLRDILQRVLGSSIVKRASPNPSRIWRLAPDVRERSLQPRFLRPLYDRLYRRNLLARGAMWHQLDRVAALGTWLGRQPLEMVS